MAHSGAAASICERFMSGTRQELSLSAGDRTVVLHEQVENGEEENDWGVGSRRLVKKGPNIFSSLIPIGEQKKKSKHKVYIM